MCNNCIKEDSKSISNNKMILEIIQIVNYEQNEPENDAGEDKVESKLPLNKQIRNKCI